MLSTRDLASCIYGIQTFSPSTRILCVMRVLERRDSIGLIRLQELKDMFLYLKAELRIFQTLVDLIK